ncbi:MAG: translation initiation factor IF-3 [Candidatus Doudnabacteria bacterium RIFCSPHIGHO2_02_FULL_46_11]|uniref:Translation initiation factor IF-3 n=1 Tax=Candidatus Doudnabacteria bacterium RIFCSPHIGHO2_02_FULL_46_11 TaxID=1817832 RepID=A0A1F5P4M9_9BACT|nr:MAG: translation initiation factor IF-3 [Candidatus Doudnabacteria bacterium RIFCSPHIGHO2_02_FULL_46_11]
MYRPVNKYFRPQKQPVARINQHIKVPEVRVVDANGEHVGVMPTHEALKLAEEAELDLVEISPTAKPPVAKIINYDKYRYQVEKNEQAKKKQAKRVEVKSIRISVRIGQHDMDTKAKLADKFLKDGKKVKVEMMLRGREKANVDYAFDQFKKYLASVGQPHSFEQNPKKMGGTIFAIMMPNS